MTTDHFTFLRPGLISSILIFLFSFYPDLSETANAQVSSEISLLPKPLSFENQEGRFSFSKKTILVVPKGDSVMLGIATTLSGHIQKLTGWKLAVHYNSEALAGKKCIQFIQPTAKDTRKEGYLLHAEKTGIRIIYHDHAGAFYAVQTLLQLLPVNVFKSGPVQPAPLSIPCCRIIDFPQYPYRGMHLDVCRHFFPVDFVKRYIDLLAMHKFNTFHWHLTDDQGWRIEIKKYPKLTETGSQRKESMIGFYDDQTYDEIPYGGYYTQEEIKEVIRYATERFVTIIPEIEMPGHSRAALAAYPELACAPGPYEVATGWGVFNEVFCPTEKTFSFLEDVLSEVCELFPGTYVHIGGDECPKVSWKASDYCQQLMRKENLKDEHELQSYFIRRMERFLASKNRKLIGWDEILDGGLAPSATVMSWRGMAGGIAAARENHDVIMTPGSHCYFDHYQSDPGTEPVAIGGYTTVQKVYAFEPVPTDSLSAEQQKHILGAQGNVWTEYITDSRHLEYMAFPRVCALAEVLWSPKEGRNWDDFSERLLHHFNRLDALKVNYARSVFDVNASVSSDTVSGTLVVLFQKYINRGVIHYTIDGSEPDSSSPVFTSPVVIRNSCTVKGMLIEGSQAGKVLSKELRLHRAAALPYTLKNPWKQYDGATAYGLTDGIYGMLNRYNTWVGFSGNDLDATVDLGKEQELRKLSISFYNKNRSWIFLPLRVLFYLSPDGINWHSVYEADVKKDSSANSIVPVHVMLDKMKARYVRVVAQNTGKCPPGHEAEGKDAWLFVDEFVVE